MHLKDVEFKMNLKEILLNFANIQHILVTSPILPSPQSFYSTQYQTNLHIHYVAPTGALNAMIHYIVQVLLEIWL